MKQLIQFLVCLFLTEPFIQLGTVSQKKKQHKTDSHHLFCQQLCFRNTLGFTKTFSLVSEACMNRTGSAGRPGCSFPPWHLSLAVALVTCFFSQLRDETDQEVIQIKNKI